MNHHTWWVAAAMGLLLGIALLTWDSRGLNLSFTGSTFFRKADTSKVFFPLEPLIVNTTDSDSFKYLRLTLTLEMDRPEVAIDVKARLTAVENVIIVMASSQDSTTLRSVHGKSLLRDNITRKINALLPRGGVRTIYFSDFLFG
jgi:flagellar basal body-associated protein FliL